MPNVTIRIDDEELIRQAKVIAVQRGISLSALLRSYLVSLVEGDEAYLQAKQRALRAVQRGISGGGAPLSRQEVRRGRVG